MIGHVAQDRDYRERFARFAVRAGLLRFGRFTTPDATVLFGPAYKGITLAAAAAMALSRGRTQPVGFCFDRKERKEHGEGGLLVGQLPTAAIATIRQIVDALSQQPVDGRALIDAELRERIQAYLQRYAPR